MTLLIDGAHVFRDGVARPASLLVRGDAIAALEYGAEERRQLRAHAAEIVDADGYWLLPGLIDAHAHAYAAILRGTENGLPLEMWALYTVLYGKALDPAALRTAILLGAAERLRAGITAFIDHTPQVHLAETALEAHEATGMRVGYAPFLHDLGDYDLMRLQLPDSLAALRAPPPLDPDRYADRFAQIVTAARGGSGRITPLLGPNAPQRCSPDAWSLWRTLRDRHDVPVHTHLLETQAQARVGHERWPGGTVLEMERQGLLEGRLSVAHGIWPDPHEQEALARNDVTIVHNPASNLMLGSGLLPFARYRALGVRLALGTDSANTGGRHDMFEAARLAFMLHRPPASDPADWPTGAEALAMATANGAYALGLEARTGRLEVGCLADLVLLRRRSSAMLMYAETQDSLVLHAGADGVHSVMIGGRWAMRDDRILTFDEHAPLAAARTIHEEISARLLSNRDDVARALPALREALHAYTLAG